MLFSWALYYIFLNMGCFLTQQKKLPFYYDNYFLLMQSATFYEQFVVILRD